MFFISDSDGNPNVQTLAEMLTGWTESRVRERNKERKGIKDSNRETETDSNYDGRKREVAP